MRDRFSVPNRAGGTGGAQWFRILRGNLERCRRRVQGRHPRQTSNALGSAASQLGPRALALTTHLNKGLGLRRQDGRAPKPGLAGESWRLVSGLARVPSKSEPTYNALVAEVCRSVV